MDHIDVTASLENLILLKQTEKWKNLEPLPYSRKSFRNIFLME